LSIEAGATVNLSDKGSANPIQIRIFELKKSDIFEASDYFALASADKATLGADLLEKDDFILRPSEIKVIKRPSHPATIAIGILAGYENTDKATWSTVYKLPPAPEAAWYRFMIPAKKIKLRIQLQANGILLTELN
jgi:type VI secretion system protein VasD